MKILVTNDDGIKAESLWALARELKKVGQVIVVAPDGERSAIGTAVTLFEPLHASEVRAPEEGVTAYAIDGSPSDCVILALGQVIVVAPDGERSAIGTAVTLFEPLHASEVRAPEEGVTAYAIDGSPSDCVILALGKLISDDVDIVVSGINPNLNLGEDVYISGTVGAAMQGYFRGLPALAISAPPGSQAGLSVAAWAARVLVKKMATDQATRIFLNVNTPNLPLKEVRGVRITRLARSSHINSVAEENNDRAKQYRLVRERVAESGSEGTDIQAIVQGYISITPLYTSLLDKPPINLLKKVRADLAREFLK